MDTEHRTGHFAQKFRPHNTLHKELSGFDFQNSLYYYNVGENQFRNWDDYRRLDFISAGHGRRYRDAMLAFNEGDVFVAYLKGCGFVGVGKILKPARMIRDIKIGRRPLLELVTPQNAANDCDDPENSEYVCVVSWIRSVPREDAKWKSGSALYTTTHVRASLDGQQETVRFIEQEFGITVRTHLK